MASDRKGKRLQQADDQHQQQDTHDYPRPHWCRYFTIDNTRIPNPAVPGNFLKPYTPDSQQPLPGTWQKESSEKKEIEWQDAKK
jgi:hypothetical protein